MNWIDGLQQAINYIEDNITERLDIEKIALVHSNYKNVNDSYVELWIPIKKQTDKQNQQERLRL